MAVFYLVIFVTAILSGSAVFLIRGGSAKWLRLMLAFSGAFLIGITFLVLVPEVFHHELPFLGLFVIAGFLLQLMLELLTEGAEHGHSHVHSENEKLSPFLLLSGLCIHAFIEGLPMTSVTSREVQNSLVVGIVVHNIPISLSLTGLFLHYGCSRMKALFYLAVFAVMTPAGAILGFWIHTDLLESLEYFFPYTMAIVIGIFLHVSTSILFEAEENHQYNIRKFTVVLLGILTALGVSLLGYAH